MTRSPYTLLSLVDIKNHQRGAYRYAYTYTPVSECYRSLIRHFRLVRARIGQKIITTVRSGKYVSELRSPSSSSLTNLTVETE